MQQIFPKGDVRSWLDSRGVSIHDFSRTLQEIAALPDGDSTKQQLRIEIEEHPRNLMIFEGWLPETFHDEGFEQIATNETSLWLAPRGSGKSTVLVFFAAWLSVAHPDVYQRTKIGNLFPKAEKSIGPWNIRIALTSNSHQKAVALLWQIKKILTSDGMTHLYGPLGGGGAGAGRHYRWKDELADTRLRTDNLREPTFTALGLGSKVTGGHYDVELHDDWVTEDNARTETQRKRLRDFWSFTIKPTLEPWGRSAIAGTRYHPKDWYGEIVKRAEKDPARWSVMRHPAIIHEDDGSERSYWPEAYTLEKLDEIREDIGSWAFESQYQNAVDLMTGGFFDSSYLEQFQAWADVPALWQEYAVTSLALDSAFKGGPKHDWSVFSICHYVQKPTRFHFERIVRGKWTKHELVRISERLVKQYKPSIFTIEAAPGVEYLLQDLRQSPRIPRRIIRGMPPRIGKVPRADKGRTLFERGWVWFDPPTKENQLRIALDELLAFTGEPGAADDCVDSMIWNLIGLTRGRGRVRRRAPGVRRA